MGGRNLKTASERRALGFPQDCMDVELARWFAITSRASLAQLVLGPKVDVSPE
jgi:hypothetical protein